MITGTGDALIDPYLRKNTVRQQVQPSIGGDRIRLTLSNEYGILFGGGKDMEPVAQLKKAAR